MESAVCSWVASTKRRTYQVLEYLRVGLRPTAVRDEAVQRVTIPNIPAEKLQYHAERLVVAVVTQTFEYMTDNGARIWQFHYWSCRSLSALARR